MAGEVKTRVSLDASRFTRGTRSIKRNIKQLERGLTIDLRKAARIAGRSIMAVAGAGAAVGAALSLGINKAIQLGARLDHLTDSTGMAAGELRVLEQAFEDNGVSAGQVGKTVNKLQKSIVEASQGLTTYQRAFDTLGLSTENLLKMTPEQQFAAVAKAIDQVEDQSQKAAAAMQIFGRQGAQLMGVFEDGAIDSARDSLGQQTEILNRRAKDFEEASTLLARSGNKMSGFFVGISDRIIDTILPLLNRMDSIDLAEQGQKFGDGLERGIRAVIGAFDNGIFGEIVLESLIIAGKNFLNLIARGWAGLIKGLSMAFIQTGKGMIDTLAAGFRNILKDLKAGLLTAVADAMVAATGEKGIGGVVAAHASIARSEALPRNKEKLLDADEREFKIAEAFLNGLADLEGFDLIDASGNKSALDKLIKSAMGSVEVRGPTLGPNITPEQLAALRGSDATDTDEARQREIFGAASSLAKIGGGGGVAATTGTEALVDQTKRQTKIQEKQLTFLEKMSDGLSKLTGLTPTATFA